MHVPCQPQNAQRLDKTEDRVELPKSQAMPGGSREPMVVIMPSLSIRNERHPPTVRRKVVRIKIPVPKRVTGRVYQPGGVIRQHQPDKHPPEHERPSAQGVEQQRQGKTQRKIHVPEKPIESNSLQVRCVPLDHPLAPLLGRRPEHPEDMGPPEAVASAVWVSVLVRKVVVLAMVGHPIDRAAFYGKRT